MTHLSPPPLHHHCHETPLHCDVLSCTAGQCGTTYTGKQDGAVNAKYRYMSICQAPYLSSMLMTSMQTDVYIPTRGDICTMQELLDTRRTELVPGCTTRTWLGTRLLYCQWLKDQLGNSNVGLHIHVHRYTLIYTCVVSFTNNMVMHWEMHGQFTSYKWCRHTYIRYNSGVAEKALGNRDLLSTIGEVCT